jgi:hypothetical protein
MTEADKIIVGGVLPLMAMIAASTIIVNSTLHQILRELKKK